MKKSQLRQIIREEIQKEIFHKPSNAPTVKRGTYEIVERENGMYQLYLDGVAVGPMFHPTADMMVGFNMDTQLLEPLRTIAGVGKFDPSMNQ